jgi:serine/threonine protein kinase
MSKDYSQRSGSSHRNKEYSPYQQHQGSQRPSSAGVTRTRRPSSGSTSGNAMNYARTTHGQNSQQGMNYMQTPVINAALLGSGYGVQGQQQSRGNVRPSSAGHSRGNSSGHHHSNGDGTSSHHRQHQHTEMPALNAGSGGGSSSRGSSSYMRPKSAGVVRQSNNNINVEGNNAMQQQQLYYQQHLAQQQMQQQQLKQQQKQQQAQYQQQRASSSGGTRPSSHSSNHQPSGGGNGDHWSTSYKLHYGYNNDGSGASALQSAAKGNTNDAVGVTDANKPPSSQRPSSATSRIRNAVPDASQKYALPSNEGNVEEADMGLDGDNQEAGGGAGGRQILNRDDDDEMDGKPVTGNRSGSRPEVSTTTPSQSVELQSSSVGGVDARSRSVDSVGDDLVDVGISTLPNQFCSCRDALDLRKLLLLSKGSRGGVVPSSTAVMDMYMVGKVVGVGSYGKVRAAWHRLTGSKVAIKTYDKSKLKDPAHWKRVHSEIKIMEQVSHPRIARMYEAVETPKRMHLIMECLDGGNLCSYVKAKRRLSEDESRKIFFQVLQSIEHLHMLGVTHRDIKLENVLFADNKDIKLIDFGFSTVCQPGKRLKVFCGTPSYMAPEIVRRTEYEGKPVDMWSLGILLYALLCGCFPFRAKSYPDLYRRIARGTFAIPEELSSSVKDLLRQLLTVDVSQRITASAAMRHSWLQVQLATSPDINKLRLETPILISDKPSDDIDEQTLAELDKFGLGKDEVIRLVLTKTHSSIATFYYLLLDVNLQKRRLMTTKRSSSGSKVRSSSSNSNSFGSNSKGETYLLQQNQGGGGVNLLRPKSASTGRPSNSGQQRPLSAFATRR